VSMIERMAQGEPGPRKEYSSMVQRRRNTVVLSITPTYVSMRGARAKMCIHGEVYGPLGVCRWVHIIMSIDVEQLGTRGSRNLFKMY
jgi:hypothetical protein